MEDILLASGSAPWIPVPHSMRVIQTNEPPVSEITTAAFIFVADREARLLLTHVNLPGRGWDIPGGHIDVGESAAEAVVRELREETGFPVDVGEIAVLGVQEFTLAELPPSDYSYPFPLSYTVSFSARTSLSAPSLRPDPESECGPAEWCSAEEVLRRCPTVSWLPFVHFLYPGLQCRTA